MEKKAKKSSGGGDTAAAGKKSSTSNNSGSSGTTAAVERKEIERKRRQHMKSLCTKLVSLVPKEHYSSKDTMTQLGSLDEAAAYIKKLKERVDGLKQKRRSAQLLASMRGGGVGASTSAEAPPTTSGDDAGSSEEAAVLAKDEAVAPVVEVRHHPDGSSLDVVLISSVERPFKMHEVVTVLEEEGAEIISANFSVAGRKVFHTIHSRAFISRIGIEVSRVYERLQTLGSRARAQSISDPAYTTQVPVFYSGPHQEPNEHGQDSHTVDTERGREQVWCPELDHAIGELLR